MRTDITRPDVESFLESKLNMQLATLDGEGFPSIQPVWFYYDKDAGKIYTGTARGTRKIGNIQKNSGKIYFSIDDENFPYKGVKGRGEAAIVEDIGRNVAMIEKINLKYLGTLDHPLAKRLTGQAKDGSEVVIEITPKFFSAWDFGRAM